MLDDCVGRVVYVKFKFYISRVHATNLTSKGWLLKKVLWFKVWNISGAGITHIIKGSGNQTFPKLQYMFPRLYCTAFVYYRLYCKAKANTVM